MAVQADVRAEAEFVERFAEFGIMAFTTARAAGSFGTSSGEPVRDVMARWAALRDLVGGPDHRLASAFQVHGAHVVDHDGAWRGWLRGDAADGHIAMLPGTGLAVTVADCVPVLIAHPSGATAALHSGWRGTVSRITEVALRRFTSRGLAACDVHLHCGPAICGRCYKVSPEVFGQLTGRMVPAPTPVDLRVLIAGHAYALGVRQISISPLCTLCDNTRFYSHRAGDIGRQLGVISAHRSP